MDFTREPIIETIITPKEGHKLAVRSSKSVSQEEYFVDAVEIVAFGQAFFFRSLERPKAFLVPVADYEILEVREARMVLKNAVLDRSIKIGGGRESALKANKEIEKEGVTAEEGENEQESQTTIEATPAEPRPDVRLDKKRDRRRHYRKRKGREEEVAKEETAESIPPLEDGKINLPPPEQAGEESPPLATSLLSSLLQPPPTLISETINRYRQNELFKGAFYLTEEEQYKPHDKVQELLNEEDDEEIPSLRDPTFAPPQEPQLVEELVEQTFSEYTVETIITSPEQTALDPEQAFSPLSPLQEEAQSTEDHPALKEEAEFSLPTYAEEDTSVVSDNLSSPSKEQHEAVEENPSKSPQE